MSKQTKRIIVAVVAVLAALVIFETATYSTEEYQYAVVKQFGKIVNVNDTPGLSFRIPFVQQVNYISKAKQFYDFPRTDVMTSDKKSMVVDAYVIYRVTDPKKFTASLNASYASCERRIDAVVYNDIKTTVSSMTQEELIIARDEKIQINVENSLDDVEILDIETEESEEKAESKSITKLLLDGVQGQMDQYGVEIESIQIKCLDLPDENKNAVYQRMITERNNIAAAYTAQGKSEAQKIRNKTDKETAIMISEANVKAAELIAEGEEKYMSILSEAYADAEKSDFYLYILSLETAKESLTNGNNTLFLDADSPIAQIFY